MKCAGSWVLLEGIDATITKTATLVPEFLDEEVHIIRPLQFHTQVSLDGVWGRFLDTHIPGSCRAALLAPALARLSAAASLLLLAYVCRRSQSLL